MNDYSVLATKVPSEFKRRFEVIATIFGMTKYELFQSLLLSLLRYFDKESSLTHNHCTMLKAFANVLNSNKDSFSPMQIKKRNIRGAILFVEESADSRPQLLYVGKDSNGQLTESMNYDKMVSEFLSSLDNPLLDKLDDIKNEFGYFSITHTLHELIMRPKSKVDDLSSEIEELFQDIRIPSGQAINVDIHYKGRYRKNVSEYTTIAQEKVYKADY